MVGLPGEFRERSSLQELKPTLMFFDVVT